MDTPDVHDKIAWGSVNVPFSEENYQKVKAEVIGHLSERRLFVVHGSPAPSAATPARSAPSASSPASALRAPDARAPHLQELRNFGEADFVVMAAPTLSSTRVYGTHSEAAVLINFQERMILVVGTQYSGEIKKSIFSVMNYLLPLRTTCSHALLLQHEPALPRHHGLLCLSGTGKTTLSAAEDRLLIGDDEHGWAEDRVFNIEGGCYAKTIDITPETEPQIWNAIHFGSMCENVVIDPETRVADYFDTSLTENGRVAYPVEFVPGAVSKGRASVPPTS